MVQSLPERDKISMHYDEMLSQLAMAMGGRVAEELIFGQDKVSSGASGDIQMATQLARAMVTEYGFSAKLGRMSYSTPNADMFHTPKIAEETQKVVDKEILKLVEDGYDTAKEILTTKRKDLDTLALGLIEYETLSGDEIKDLLEGKKPTRDY
jgi:cell division protease FtsH